jgi:hypothetical protein
LEEREALAANAFTHIRENFTTATMTSKTLDIYREALRLRN